MICNCNKLYIKKTYFEKIILEFFANWCPANKRLDKILQKLFYKFKKELVFYRVNIDTNPDVIKKFNIKKLPTIIYYKDSKEQKRIIGIKSKKEIEKFLLETYE